jgi:hypothetical protein
MVAAVRNVGWTGIPSAATPIVALPLDLKLQLAEQPLQFQTRNSKATISDVDLLRGLGPAVRHDHLRPVPGSSMVVETVPICVRSSRAEGDGRTAVG